MLFDDANVVNIFLKDNDNNKENKLVDDSVGLVRGNMFNNEYVPYLNYQPGKLVPKNDKEILLLKIYETDFALHDLNLYLDLHPKDQSLYETFKKYVNEYNSFKDIYEKKYGQLDLESGNLATYGWTKYPWPWDKEGGSMYV